MITYRSFILKQVIQNEQNFILQATLLIKTNLQSIIKTQKKVVKLHNGKNKT